MVCLFIVSLLALCVQVQLWMNRDIVKRLKTAVSVQCGQQVPPPCSVVCYQCFKLFQALDYTMYFTVHGTDCHYWDSISTSNLCLSLSVSLFCLSWKTVYAHSGEKKNFLRLWCPFSRAEQHISYSPKSQFWVPFICINTPNFWGTDFLLELYRNPKISSTHSIH